MIRLKIETFDDGSLQHDCSGNEALVMPVVNRTGDTIDTLAWIEDQPFAWWRHRLIGQVLGDKALQVWGLRGGWKRYAGTVRLTRHRHPSAS